MRYSPRQYATALTNALLPESPDQQAEIADALRSIGHVLKDGRIRSSLSAPGLSSGERALIARTVVEAAYKGSVEYISVLAGLLVSLVSNSSLNYLTSIATQVDIKDRPEITLAHHQQEELTAPLQKKIAPSGTEVTVHEDPDIVGGLIVRRGDDVIDMSLRTALEKMRSQFSTRSISAI